MTLEIRDADTVRDAAECARIYAPYVADSVISLEADPPDVDEFVRRMERYTPTHPWLVAEDDRHVCGFAYASPHRERSAYRWAVEVSVYIEGTYHRRGIGRTLYSTLFDLLARQGRFVACAGVTLPNPASVGLHESLGFTPVGVYRGIGWKFGRWHDVGWWQRELVSPLPSPPPEPGPPIRIDRR